MFGLMRKKTVIKLLAEELARLQIRADKWFYVSGNQEMSSFVLNHVEEVKKIAGKFRVAERVYEDAYKIYDFRNSGKAGFVPNIDFLKNS